MNKNRPLYPIYPHPENPLHEQLYGTLLGHLWFGLQTKIVFETGSFTCVPGRRYAYESYLAGSYDYDCFVQFPLLVMPKEIEPVFYPDVLGIEKYDSPEEVKRKLFDYNSKTTLVIRQLAHEFELGANIPDAWRLVAASYPIHKYYNLPLKSKIAIVYLLTCIRYEILREDFRKRDVPFESDYCFSNFMYLPNTKSEHKGTCCYELIDINLLAIVYDIMNLILCSYVYKNKEASSFMFLKWDDKSLEQLRGLQGVYKHADLKVIREVLCDLYMNVSTFYTRILEVEQEDKSVIESLSDLNIIKRIFKIVSKLESYAMNF